MQIKRGERANGVLFSFFARECKELKKKELYRPHETKHLLFFPFEIQIHLALKSFSNRDNTDFFKVQSENGMEKKGRWFAC